MCRVFHHSLACMIEKTCRLTGHMGQLELAYADRGSLGSYRLPVKCVHVLQDSQSLFTGQRLAQEPWQVLGRKVRLAEEHDEHGLGMLLSHLRNFRGRMPIA